MKALHFIKNGLMFIGFITIAFVVLQGNIDNQRQGKESTDGTWTAVINVGSQAYVDNIDSRQGLKSAKPGFKVFNPRKDTMTILAQAKENSDTTAFVLPPCSWFPIVFKKVFASYGDTLLLITK